MTLGGFALAVGILVDNGTVVIENIERHVQEGEPLEKAIIQRGRRSRRSDHAFDALHLHRVRADFPACKARPNICSRRLSLSVCVSLIASLALSFTLVPVLFKYLMRSSVEPHNESDWLSTPPQRQAAISSAPFIGNSSTASMPSAKPIATA